MNKITPQIITDTSQQDNLIQRSPQLAKRFQSQFELESDLLDKETLYKHSFSNNQSYASRNVDNINGRVTTDSAPLSYEVLSSQLTAEQPHGRPLSLDQVNMNHTIVEGTIAKLTNSNNQLQSVISKTEIRNVIKKTAKLVQTPRPVLIQKNITPNQKPLYVFIEDNLAQIAFRDYKFNTNNGKQIIKNLKETLKSMGVNLARLVINGETVWSIGAVSHTNDETKESMQSQESVNKEY